MNDDSVIERLERVFPEYLTAPSKKKLAQLIYNFPEDRNYFSSSWEGPEEPLQGDAWNGFCKVDFESKDEVSVAGVVLSNSCDIDENNISIRNRNVIFAPLLRLSDYEKRLESTEASEEKIKQHLEAVKRQEKSEIFYLPASNRTKVETLIQFDDIGVQPLGHFRESRGEKLFRLNPYGFYVFLMKLSIHFTRFGERLDRGW